MTAILLVSHGGYAKAMLETAEMILGPQDHAAAVGLSPSESPEELKQEIKKAMDSLAGMDLLVLTDVTSGTPFNTVMSLSLERTFRHMTGVNLPLLIDALISRQGVPLEELVNGLKRNAAGTFVDVDERMIGETAGNEDEDDF